MAVIRVEKTKDYTIMSNYHFKEKDMSLKAKGLLSLILSLPEEWDYTMEGLSMLCKDGIDSVRTALKELMEFGYVEIARVRDEKGQLRGTEYVVYERPISSELENKEPVEEEKNPVMEERVLEEPTLEKPTLEKPISEKPILENPILEKPMLEKPRQLNTNISNTNKLNTNISNHDGSDNRAYYPDNVQLNDAFKAFVYMRKRIGKPLTTTAMGLIKDSLAKMAKGEDGKLNIEKAVGILNQSVMNSWPGLYELKRSIKDKNRGLQAYSLTEEEWTNLEKQLMAN